MTKLERAIKLYKYMQTIDLEHPRYKQMLKDLGWEKEMSWQQLRRMFLNLVNVEHSNVPYCREIMIIKVLSANSFNKPYMANQEIIYECEWDGEVSQRSIRRYIKEIRDSNIKICTKKCTPSGYKIDNPIGL